MKREQGVPKREREDYMIKEGNQEELTEKVTFELDLKKVRQ